eukprot:GILJ01009329.1.p1 GENE.GILJ01009329.1~~GILJ01009329.1.p1  ORF type:complete len:238 (+),score=17.67 GILJ01009329.1:48-761(+)
MFEFCACCRTRRKSEGDVLMARKYETMQLTEVLQQPSYKTLPLDTTERYSREVLLFPEFVDQSSILSSEQQTLLACVLSVRYRVGNFSRLYSLSHDGSSFHTFYRRVTTAGPNLLICKDQYHNIFGCFASDSWKTVSRCFYGSPACFLFTFYPTFRVFRAQEKEIALMKSDRESICMGGGDAWGLQLQKDFLVGSSSRCSTFNNDPLTCTEEFQLLDVEVFGWKFQPQPCQNRYTSL